MNLRSHLKSNVSLGESRKNIGSIFLDHRSNIGRQFAFAQRDGATYRYWSWDQLTDDIFHMIAYFAKIGVARGSRVAFVTSNSYKRLVSEMAVMSMGAVSVPIFVGYKGDVLGELLSFSEVVALVVESEEKLGSLPKSVWPKEILVLEGSTVQNSLDHAIQTIYDPTSVLHQIGEVESESLAMIMFTSGTTNLPKGVMLTHRNILSQQKALEILWKPQVGMRFLCYLPWHHSFGGLFERFLVLHSGGCLAIDDSWGRDIERLFENFHEVRPHIYFSVPKVYQEIVNRVLVNERYEKCFFHSDLKFVFTAAAPLSLNVSEVFRCREVPVIEGWGLTETSPCCTLTDFSLTRTPGIVGFPIPGVEVALGDEDEILVRGPNVMRGYFKNERSTREVLSPDGWLHTGDVGEITDQGVKIVSRKDRVFKLTNGEKVFPSGIELRLQKGCHFIKFAYVFGSGLPEPVALFFPSHELFQARGSDQSSAFGACHCPGSVPEYSKCLSECLRRINQETPVKFERISKALLVDTELSIDRNELTPSFKLIPKSIEKNYQAAISFLKEGGKVPQGCYWIALSDEGR